MDDITRHPAVEWRGAVELIEEPEGIRPSRVPPASRSQLMVATHQMGMWCSGVRLSFRTDATEIRLDVKPMRFTQDGLGLGLARIDLLVDGERVERAVTDAGLYVHLNGADMDFEDHGSAAIMFDGLAAGMKHLEFWLPHDGQILVHGVHVTPNATVDPPPSAPKWIHYGSSISHCVTALGPSEVWPAVAARNAGLDLTSMAVGGECHIDQYVARYIRDAPADVLSFKLGANTYVSMVDRTFRSAVHGFLDTVRDGHPMTPIVLVSPVFCPVGETTVGPLELVDGQFVEPTVPNPVPGALTFEVMRVILEEIVTLRREEGDQNLHYLHGHQLFGAEDEPDFADRIHPTPEGYMRIGERFASRVFGAKGILADEDFNADTDRD